MRFHDADRWPATVLPRLSLREKTRERGRRNKTKSHQAERRRPTGDACSRGRRATQEGGGRGNRGSRASTAARRFPFRTNPLSRHAAPAPPPHPQRPARGGGARGGDSPESPGGRPDRARAGGPAGDRAARPGARRGSASWPDLPELSAWGACPARSRGWSGRRRSAPRRSGSAGRITRCLSDLARATKVRRTWCGSVPRGRSWRRRSCGAGGCSMSSTSCRRS